MKQEGDELNQDMTQSSKGDSNRNPEQEFFMLAVLTHKVLHNEKYDDTEYVYQTNASTLYKEAKSQNLPFHKWYKWLEVKFDDLRIQEMGPDSLDRASQLESKNFSQILDEIEEENLQLQREQKEQEKREKKERERREREQREREKRERQEKERE